MRDMAVIERGESSWGAPMPNLPGCVAVGESREEVVGLIRDAIRMHVEDLRRRGLSVPRPTADGVFVDLEAA